MGLLRSGNESHSHYVVVLSNLDGLSCPEMREVLAVPTGTVNSRLFPGRRLLRQSLYEYALEMGYVRPEERVRAGR